VPGLLSISLVAVLALCCSVHGSADELALASPQVGGNVYRGLKADLRAQYPKDREVTWFQFSSCTCDIQVEQSAQFLGKTGTRTLFRIELTTGRARSVTKFSLVPSEAEVLLPPNSRFVVLGQLDAGNGLIIITLRELPSCSGTPSYTSTPLLRMLSRSVRFRTALVLLLRHGTAVGTTTCPPSFCAAAG
jgi:hypothetical protein